MRGPFNRSLKRIQYSYANRLQHSDDPIVNFAKESLYERIQSIKKEISLGLIYSNEPLSIPKIPSGIRGGFSNKNRVSRLDLEYDEESSPIKPSTFDCSVSFLTLQWTNNIFACLKNYHGALKDDSFLIGSLFGAGTLSELDNNLRRANESYGVAKNHCGPWVAPDVFTGCMKSAGFSNVVVDPDHVTCKYEDLESMVLHLRRLALTSCSTDMPSLHKSEYQKMKQWDSYELSFGIINFIGWK